MKNTHKISIYCYTLTAIFTLLISGWVLPERDFVQSKVSAKGEGFTEQQQTPDTNFGKIPVYFEENQGQFNERVKYFARGTSGYSLFLTGTEAVYVLQEKVVSDKEYATRDESNPKSKIQNLKSVAVYMRLADANKNPLSSGIEQMPHKTNYFKGRESNWRTGIPNFRQIRMENVYQGIDAVWKGKTGGGVQYDFVVKPNANPDLIEWEVEGAETVEIDEKGDLLIKTEYGEIRQQKPFTFQESETNGLKQEIESGFKIKSTNNEQTTNKYRIGFELGSYDHSKTLTIDPSVNLSNLAFSTFLGGGNFDEGNSIEVDRAGNIYVAGETASTNFPTTPGSFDRTRSDGIDVFVTKLNSTATDLIFSTYLGGSSTDIALDMAVSRTGEVFICGYTNSPATDPFPTTTGAFDTTYNGFDDAFVTKIDSTGANLSYSTLLGGSANTDRAEGISINAQMEAFITGGTFSTDFPTTTGAFDETYNGSGDAFVAKLNSTGSSLAYSTFIGGDASDGAFAIAIDSNENAYITGDTGNASTADFPTTMGAYDQVFNGGTSDIFVTKLNNTGSGLIYSTFLGGSNVENGRDIKLETGLGFVNAVIYGESESTNYPTTLQAFDRFHNGNSDAVLTKLDSAGENLIFSTYIGGSGHEDPFELEIDFSGSIFVSGITNSTDYPTTPGAYNPTLTTTSTSYVSRLDSTGFDLMYSTFIPGNIPVDVHSIDLDSTGNVYITGGTGSSDFPTTENVFQPNKSGSRDAFVTKLGDFSISGQTRDYDGNPIPSVRMALSGASNGLTITDAEGFFSFTDTALGNFAVSANRPFYQFNPGTFQFPNLSGNQFLYFIGQPVSSGPTAAPASLGGDVISTAGNVGLPNTKLTLIDAVSGDVFVTTTDANGDYQFENITTGMFYLIVPEREGYNFNPGIYEINHLEQNLGLDFVASPNSPRPVNDFDGDGKTDLAVFRPESGVWYIWNTQDNSVTAKQFGLPGDVPVASDYDGDNRADIAVYRPSEGNWYWLDSLDGEFHAVHFGQAGDLPVQADFDGDNKTDLAVYRPDTGVWHQLLSENGNYQSIHFGIETDVPVTADYDSDGKADLSVFRGGIWYRLRSSDSQVEGFQFGLEGDKPQVGDFDGDGRIDTAVYRPSNGAWYWLDSTDGEFQAKQFGISTDVPVPADYNGDGRYEQAIFRDGNWFVLRPDNSYYANRFGQTGDVPIP